MKKILFYILILNIGVCSCKDFLNTVPTDSLTEGFYYNTESNLNSALAGVYQPLLSAALYGRAMWLEFGITDECYYARSSSTTGVLVYNFNYGETYVNDFWSQLYQGIERANLLIKNINLAQMDSVKREAILGEALFLRGYYYYLLANNFGDVPLKTEPTGSVTDVNIAFTPVKEVYNQILKDMQAAENKVNTATTLGYGGRVSKTTVEGILARVCLTMAGYPLYDESKYADALAWCKKVVTSGEHQLNPSYRQLFINMIQDKYDVKESMWEKEAKGPGTEGFGGSNWTGAADGIALSANYDAIGYSYGFICCTAKLFNSYAPGDLRRDWAIAQYSYNSATTPVSRNYFTPTQIYNRFDGKFRREYELTPVKGKNTTPINSPILRYADVLLMLAEAENHVNGPTPLAYDALNQVRRRGFGLDPNTPATSVSVVKGVALSSAGNTGYLKTVPVIPVTITGGNGTGATGEATVSTSTGKVTAIAILNPGSGYTTAPTITIGTAWAPNTSYSTGTQVFNGNNLYTVTTSGTSTATPPTQSSGASSAAITGAVFTYAGLKATATASVETSVVDLSGLSQSAFLQTIQDERSRELCFESVRRNDLIRWGIFVPTMNELADNIKATAGSLAYAALAGSNVTSRNLLFPIPASEMTVNKAAKQNPGW